MRRLLLWIVACAPALAAAPFAHAPHAATACADCHTRGEDGKLAAPAQAGCAVTACHGEGFTAPAPAPFEPRLQVPFPHEVPAHAQDCAICHTATLDARAARPWLATVCFECHAEETDGVTPCAPCHAVEGPPKRATGGLLRPTLHGLFDHAPHAVDAKLACGTCHDETRHAARPAGTPLMERPRCLECHEERDVPVGPRDCAACHGEDLSRVKPVDHDGGWRFRHPGEGDRRELAGHGQDCSTCHGPDACRDCHRTAQPRSHTGLWRDHLHGRAASWDREACATCHEPGTCVSCHRTTRPLNHRGAWRQVHGLVAGSQADSRCTTCHQPTFCADCHRGGR